MSLHPDHHVHLFQIISLSLDLLLSMVQYDIWTIHFLYTFLPNSSLHPFPSPEMLFHSHFTWFAGTIQILKCKNLDTVSQMWPHWERFPLTPPCSGGLAASSQGSAVGSNSGGFFFNDIWALPVFIFCRQAGESLICFWRVPWPPMVLASLLKQLTCPMQPQCHWGRADRAMITRSTLWGYTHFIVSYSKKCGKLP